MTFITLGTSAFEMFVIMTYLNGFLKTRKSYIPKSIFVGCFIVMETILFLYQYGRSHISDTLGAVTNIGVGILTTFLLCLLYETEIRKSVLAAVLFQILGIVAELLFTLLIFLYDPDTLNTNNPLIAALISLGCTLVLLILISVFSFCIILASLPYQVYYLEDDRFFVLIMFFFLVMLNITSYILLTNSQKTYDLKQRNVQMGNQIQFQKEKYEQISAAYKNGRRIIHDTKKHYFAMREYIKRESYDQLNDYISNAMEHLEETYTKYNTGNLVIDSFLTNYKSIADGNHIPFSAVLNIDVDKIPLSDYDLCVVLGNLLDNCMEACDRIPARDAFITVEIYTGDNCQFVIHTCNPIPTLNVSKQNENRELYHGYGTENVKRIVAEYHGAYQVIQKKEYEVYVILPITVK